MILAIYCAGGLGREVIELARALNRWERIIYVDDITEEKMVAGADVYRFEEAEQFRGNIEFIIATGEPVIRKMLYEKIKSDGYPLATLIGPWCTMLPETHIGEGCIIYDSALSTNITVGDNVLMNGRVLIGHDACIGAHTVLSALCFIGGGTEIGECCYMAPGSMTKDHIHIGDDAIISLGAVVLRHVRPKSIMIGNPAKHWAENTERKVFQGR